MVVVKHVFFGLISFAFLLYGCASQPSLHQTVNSSTPISSTRAGNLDSIIQEGSDYIRGRISANSKIGVVNMQSLSVNLANYIIDSIVMHLVNTDEFIVVERSELDIIQNEQQYQLSGEVSDSTAVSIGHQLGVQFIITGSIMPLGDNYSLRLKITNVQTAQIMGTRIYTVRPDDILLTLLNSPAEKQAETAVETIAEPSKETPQPVHIDNVIITNNNTTTINGDVYINMPNGFGW
jgi:TolB-like protein